VSNTFGISANTPGTSINGLAYIQADPGNTADILIQASDPEKAARFYVEHLGFEISDDNPKMIGLHGRQVNLLIEPGPRMAPVLEVTVDSVESAKARLLKKGCLIVKTSLTFPDAT
jgi:predicted enzyme related to lactoylglutathione lyase